MKRSFQIRFVPSIIAVAMALCASSLCQAQSADGSTGADNNTRVRALFREGVAAFNAGKPEEAVKTLSEAWSIRQSYDVAAALAQAEIQLKRYRDAAEHLDFCLSHFAPVESEQTLRQIKNAFAEVKLHVGAFKIAVDHPGAEVRVDDKPVGTSPLGAVVFVDPGQHALEARLGADKVTQTVHVDPGEQAPVEMKFGAANIAPPTSSPSDHPAADTQRSIVPVIVGGAAFIIGAGSAIGFELAASSKDDTARSLRGRTGPSGCAAGGGVSATDCGALHDALNARDRDHNWATAGIVLAGVAAIATPLYWFWPRSNATAADGGVSSVTVRASASPAGGNVWFSGQF